MATFQIKFYRYDDKTGEGRISNVMHHCSNDGFDAAYKYANTMLLGMQSADPERTFEIISILSHEYRGIKCDGSRLFETTAELAERVKPA